ncbi:MAG: DUF3306 domain-containing protein [Xanthobacteraceae bacterium]
MNDPEGFLSRWSRRKRNSADAKPDRPEAANSEESVRADASEVGEQDKAFATSAEATEKKDEAAEPAFDLSKLPSIESITAETDIRLFLAPGVPPALTRAALRRAWVIDPKIRDFIEMAENQWDFTAPGVPGFDLSPPTGDVARMVAEIFGDRPAAELPAEPTVAEKRDEEQAAEARAELPAAESSSHRIVNESAMSDAPQVSRSEIGSASPREIAERRQDDAAAQQDGASQDEVRHPARLTHGRAVPR